MAVQRVARDVESEYRLLFLQPLLLRPRSHGWQSRTRAPHILLLTEQRFLSSLLLPLPRPRLGEGRFQSGRQGRALAEGIQCSGRDQALQYTLVVQA